LRLGRDLPADVAALDAKPEVARSLGFEGVKVIGIGATVKAAPLKQIQTALKYLTVKVPGYDFYVFSGNWAQLAARNHRPNIWYCHTPPRLLYDLNESYAQRLNPVVRVGFRAWTWVQRLLDQRNMRYVDRVVANSENTRQRIRTYYGIDAPVLHAPVDTTKYYNKPAEDYWLSVGRIYPEKRVELQVEAFRKMPGKKLKIVGPKGGRYADDVLANLPANVEYLGEADDARLKELYARCRGLICTAGDEDFGITVIEAMASGKPAVAVDEGGYRETVVDGVTGRLCRADADSITEAVKEVDRDPLGFRLACGKRAREFDTAVFNGRLKELIGGKTG